ncbi:ankyrin repeat-containing domain protein [Nemania sp. FL0031]|nr:ankyrin repeat-containing domain protein [Nemania sp. FL0031]
MTEPPRKKQRRHLNYDKCRFCRNDKKACTPGGRVWPQKCDRCVELELECSENSRAAGAPPLVAPQSISQIIETTQMQKLRDLSLRVTWLSHLNFYQNSIRAVATGLRELLGQKFYSIYNTDIDDKINEKIDSVEKVINDEKHSLYADLLDESILSSNPLVAPLALSLETLEVPSSRGQYKRYSSRELVNRLWENGDLSTALYMQENLLLQNHSDATREAVRADLQKYCDIYSAMIERLTAIVGHNIPDIPPLHNLLTRTELKANFPLRSTESHLILMKDYMDRSLLHVALDLRVEENIVRSIGHQEALPTEDRWRRRPIHIASSGNSEAIVNYLIQKGAKIGTEDYGKHSALAYASAMGNETIVRLLITRGARVNQFCYDGQTPLSLAGRNGHTSTVQLLLEQDADVNIGEGLYPAVTNGHTAIVRLLLEKSTDINTQRALFLAVENGHTSMVQLMLENGAKFDIDGLLWRAAGTGYTAIIRLLLKKSTDSERTRALYQAAVNGNPSVVRLFLKKSPEIDTRRALLVAAGEGHTSVVRLLLDNGADINHQSPQGGSTSLLTAARNGNTDVFQLLLNYGADPSISNDRGLTPLEAAVNRGHRDIVRILEQRSAANVPRSSDR